MIGSKHGGNLRNVKNNQLSFLDQLTNDLGAKRTAEFFHKRDRYIPWNELAEPLKATYASNTDTRLQNQRQTQNQAINKNTGRFSEASIK